MYLKLVSVFFKENFSLKRLFGFDLKKNKTKTVLIGFAIIYALAAYMFGFGFMFFDLADIMNQANQIQVILSFSVTYVIGLSVMMTLFRASGYLFHYKDYDILAPLPIPDFIVLLGKITVMLLMIYITSFIFVLPIAFAYFFFKGISVLSLVYFLIGFILTPLIPLVVLAFVSLGLDYITKKLPFAKILNIILLFAIFIGIFALSFSFNDTEVNPLTGQVDMVKGLSDVYPLIGWYIDGVHDLNHLSMLYYVLVAVVVFGLFILLVNPVIRKTNQSKTKGYISKKTKVNYDSKGLVFTMVIKEIKKYFSVPIYAVNTGLGPVILLVLGIASFFFKSDIESILVQLMAVDMSLEPLLLILFGFSIVMTYTPAVSLSLEGKNFWIIKSLPIEPRNVMISKIIFNLILIVPIGLISLVMLGFNLSIDPLSIIVMMYVVVGLSVLSSLINAYLNLFMPKFDFQNEVEVVKQSIASLVGVFGGFALIVTFGFAYYYLNKVISTQASLFIIGTLMAFISTVLYVYLKPVSEKQFRQF